jgi:hypothetical protein
MLSKVLPPKTKAELIAALQKASFRSFDVYEGASLDRLPSKAELVRAGSSVIVVRQ